MRSPSVASRLYFLRWLEIACQALVLWGASRWLGLDGDRLVTMSALIGGFALFNVFAGLRLRLKRLQAQYGQTMIAPHKPKTKPTGPSLSKSMLRRLIRRIERRLQRLKEKRQKIPARVLVKDLPGDPLLRLSRERQHLTQCLKMVAYQAESDLLALVRPHYARADQEGRTLITSALQSAADLQVGKEQLTVMLAPLSSAHRSQAIAALCEKLNKMEICFPGTRLRLHYAVAEEPV